MTTATKCIAVKTPYGNMYLELNNEGEYEHAKHDAAAPEIDGMGKAFYFTPKYSKGGWIECFFKQDKNFAGYLEIVSHYGDKFPQ